MQAASTRKSARRNPVRRLRFITADGLFKYQYDAWNRLVGAWYNDGNMDDSDERVATYEYDGLPALDAAAADARRWSRSDRGATLRPAVSRIPSIEKTVGNQGTGVVHGSDGSGDITGIEAGNRHEHYFWGGMGVSPVNWRLIETTNHAESGGDYSYSDADVLSQFVYGTQYIDEPLVYDRNEDPNEDNSCLDVDGGEDADGDSCRYFYHQDANFRVTALTDESAAVVERYRYTAYGEPVVFGGENASGDELANAMFVSSVGNPFMHQGLFRDTDIASYQNRYRQYDAKWGRFLQRDPLGYGDGANMYAYLGGAVLAAYDPLGLWGAGRRVHEKELKQLYHLLEVYQEVRPHGAAEIDAAKERIAELEAVPLGHSDFPGYDEFDWVKEDTGFWTSPINILTGTGRHFRSLSAVEKDIEKAIENCNKSQFESLGHQGQDYFSHLSVGLDPEAHLHDPTADDPEVYQANYSMAAEWTQKQVDKWYANCCKDKNGNWKKCCPDPPRRRPAPRRLRRSGRWIRGPGNDPIWVD